MTGASASLLAAGIPKPLFVAWSAIMLCFCVVSHLRLILRYRRLAVETEAKMQRLEQRMDEFERKTDAEIARMQAALNAYGTWSEANDRFFHHGLVAVSHLIGARAMPARRACASERQRTRERRSTETAWRPVAPRAPNAAAPTPPAMRAPRRARQ